MSKGQEITVFKMIQHSTAVFASVILTFTTFLWLQSPKINRLVIGDFLHPFSLLLISNSSKHFLKKPIEFV